MMNGLEECRTSESGCSYYRILALLVRNAGMVAFQFLEVVWLESNLKLSALEVEI